MLYDRRSTPRQRFWYPGKRRVDDPLDVFYSLNVPVHRLA